MKKRICLGVMLFLAALASVQPQEIDNREVFLLASRVADDVELIREVMGRPYDDSPRLPASEVSALELYFQAQTLFRKANQLAQDFGLAEREVPPPAPERELTAADTHAVITQAAEQIGRVKQSLEIATELVPQRRQASISLTGVFMTIIDVNRQLNLLIDEPIRVDDVFDQLMLSASYGAGILSKLAPSTSLPAPPAFSGYKTPADVYAQVLSCIESVSRIASESGVSVMSLSSRRNIPDDIEPGHVYDVATILTADLATLAIALAADGVPVGYARPQRVFPSHAYEVGDMLQRQLVLIDALL